MGQMLPTNLVLTGLSWIEWMLKWMFRYFVNNFIPGHSNAEEVIWSRSWPNSTSSSWL